MKRLRCAAQEGWRGIAVAIFAYRDNPLARPVRRRIWGPRPGIALALVALACCVVGALIEAKFGAAFFLLDDISWPVVVFSFVVALRMRSVLRSSKELLAQGSGDEGFAAFALPLFPAAVLLVLMAPVARIAVGLPPISFDPGALTGPIAVLVFVTDTIRSALGLGAALAVVSATLCYRKEWTSALMDLVMRGFMFGIMIMITLMLVGFANSMLTMLISAVVRAITSWVLPPWFSEMLEAFTDNGAMALVHLALIAGVWLAARGGFRALQQDGDVDLMAILSDLLGGADEDEDEAPEKPADVTVDEQSGATKAGG